MEKFLYVFNSDTKDYLVANGYALLKEDEHNKIYVFVNKPEVEIVFDDKLKDESVILSNILTF